MAKYFTDLAVWRDLLAGDFNRGYFAGVVLVLAVVLVLLAIRIVLSFIFRNRRVRSIVVPAADGEESGVVKQVYLKGYKKGDKVLRYAQVIVTQ